MRRYSKTVVSFSELAVRDSGTRERGPDVQTGSVDISLLGTALGLLSKGSVSFERYHCGEPATQRTANVRTGRIDKLEGKICRLRWRCTRDDTHLQEARSGRLQHPRRHPLQNLCNLCSRSLLNRLSRPCEETTNGETH